MSEWNVCKSPSEQKRLCTIDWSLFQVSIRCDLFVPWFIFFIIFCLYIISTPSACILAVDLSNRFRNINNNEAVTITCFQWECSILLEDTVEGSIVFFSLLHLLIEINDIFIYSLLIEITHVIDRYRFA